MLKRKLIDKKGFTSNVIKSLMSYVQEKFTKSDKSIQSLMKLNTFSNNSLGVVSSLKHESTCEQLLLHHSQQTQQNHSHWHSRHS